MAEQEYVSRIPELDVEFVFRKRPMAIPADLRPTWKIALAVLILKNCCRSSRSTLTRLHVLSWACRSEVTRKSLRSVIAGDLTPDTLIVRFEPSLNRAVDFAVGEKLISKLSGGRIELTSLGQEFANELEEDKLLLSIEKQFLAEIRQKVTETLINKIF